MKANILDQLRRLTGAYDQRYAKQSELVALIDTLTSSYEDAAWVLKGGYTLDFQPAEIAELDTLLGETFSFLGELNGFWVIAVGDQPYLIDHTDKTVEVLTPVFGGASAIKNMTYAHGYYYATAANGGLRRTASLYQAWTPVGALPFTVVTSDANGVVLTAGDGIAQFSSDGVTWTVVEDMIDFDDVVAVSMDSNYWAICMQHNVRFSQDFGVSWHSNYYSQDAASTGIAVDILRRVLVITESERASYYDPQTDLWSTVILPSIPVDVIAGKLGLWVYVDTMGAVWRSVDGARNWSRIHTVEGSYQLVATGQSGWMLAGTDFQYSAY